MRRKRARLKSTWTIVDGYRIHARVSTNRVPAERIPIVLVHGLSVSSLYFLPTARALAPDYRVYAPDLPGFGRSTKPAHVLDIAELAEVLAGYLRVTGVERAAMIANSLGCQTLVELAIRHPSLVDRAVLIGPTMDAHARTILGQGWRLLRDSLREPLSQPFVVGYDYLRTGLRRTLRTLRYGLDHHIEDRLPYVQAPLLITRGARDPIASQQWIDELTSRAPQARQVVFSGAAHTVNYSAADDLARVTRFFLHER
jgi:2-hydroxy-6-oxonona-2,4-dienedioate hydrolase